ncbi:T9SS type A sorting domain-containing protein [Pseudozobellia sp. WGM2]|uniref:T9SS type A sorting domain-containing protein n=1 Tax=Pseudozobellia sp. WGM2 TaxID=2787625 RepID=UPI001ADF2469|nr:T9SS type A sorting domain-containing protein [Pseudozobellia sp. WGM2]
MKQRLLLLLTLFSVIASAQQKLKFIYDTAGNQILRDRVCATCLKAMMPKESDSLSLEAFDTEIEVMENISELEIIAYPNPVTQTLFVDWFPHKTLLPTRIQVFSVEGRLVMDIPVKGSSGEKAIDFGQNPPGLYMVNVLFANGEKRFFKVIRQQ